MSILKAALCQFSAAREAEATKEKAARMIREAAENGAQLIVLPEMWCCPYTPRAFRPYAEADGGRTQAFLSALARETGVVLAGGSIPEREGGKLYNTAFIYGPDGRELARHRKAHLFDVDIPGMRFKESDSFAPGDAVTVFDTPFGKMGAAVCFDLRFPELFRAMTERGARIVLLPAQFNLKTGPRHWELLLRARAADNQLFVLGCAAARDESSPYTCWGHSTAVDPFGMVCASCDETEQILYAALDMDEIDEARRQIPTLSALREDLYPVAK